MCPIVQTEPPAVQRYSKVKFVQSKKYTNKTKKESDLLKKSLQTVEKVQFILGFFA